MDAYDVIIIGTGAGGGTLARHLAPSGQADPAARARRLAAARAGRTGSPRTCSSTTATSRRTPGTTRKGKPFQPQIHYFVGGATKLYGAALYRLRERGLRRAPPPRRHLAGVADLLRRARAVLHARRAAVRGARRARRGPHRAAGERAVPVPGASRTSRASSSSRDDLAAAGYHPFHAPCGMRARTRRTCRTAPACAARTATASRASSTRKSDAEVLGVRPALEHAERHAADERAAP